MNISTNIPDGRVPAVRCSEDSVIVDLMDGRTISVPLTCYPRLHGAMKEQRTHWVIAGGGYGIHWPDSVASAGE